MAAGVQQQRRVLDLDRAVVQRDRPELLQLAQGLVDARAAGAQHARELFLLGQKFTAEEALAFGLYTRVFPDESLREETLKVARQLAAGPASSWAYMKQNLNAAEDEGFARHLDRESMNMGLSTRAYFSALKARTPGGA